ncbi:class I SAM-dependent methyltransferase [Botryobacter ruber]|uniref:class I SAM-dependent methyltransferase n=1 Tax=Botryobacter ruber TaxID=2171629 RepID=UPI000E0B932D|nr:class I SAM-dependent methyltransferase [Botryobacter ruber]
MQYDPIKRVLGDVFNKTPFLRRVFYNLLDLLLLRAWHVHKELNVWAAPRKGKEQYILDAGSGFGQYTYYLSSMSNKWSILAVDVKEEQISDSNQFFRAIGRHNVFFKIADLVQLRQPNSYDLILSVDVMEHIEEDVAVFQNFYASLRSGGMLVISTPSDQGGSDVHGGSDTSFIEEHVRDGYNIQEIQAKLRKAGFRKVEARYSYGKPGQVSWRLSMKYPLLMLEVSKLFFVVLPFYYLFTFPVSLVLNWMDVNGKHETGTGLIVKAWK